MPLVRFGVSRQVTIPKKIVEQLGLKAGDYLEVELKGTQVIFTPKEFIDKSLDNRLAQSLKDIEAGRFLGPFRTAKETMQALRSSQSSHSSSQPIPK